MKFPAKIDYIWKPVTIFYFLFVIVSELNIKFALTLLSAIC